MKVARSGSSGWETMKNVVPRKNKRKKSAESENAGFFVRNPGTGQLVKNTESGSSKTGFFTQSSGYRKVEPEVSCTDTKYTLYTDGACDPNPGTGGWAYILKDNETGKEYVGSGGERDTTNNRMEMMAVLKGLLKLAYPSEVTIVSDSTYVINGMRCWMPSWKRKGWSRGNKDIKNLDIWMQLDVAISGHRVAYKWVKGHAGHEYNERCDKLAMKEVLKHKRR